ncbi:MAG: GMC family oxidoreductase [Solirubrobacterales bacterium]|nr:GMC family oxidoreductase [Solirubrobacterales bacterium]
MPGLPSRRARRRSCLRALRLPVRARATLSYAAVTYEHDYDWIVIGSGFGGSVSALRLAEKGYRVAVIEAGSRFEDEDFAESTWDLRRYFYYPKFGLRGIMRMYAFKDVAVLAGAGVGGGSLVYANTLYKPGESFFNAEEWSELADWHEELDAHYDTAKRMLGATQIPFSTDADALIGKLGERLGVADTYRRPEVSVYFGDGEAPGETVPDPYFGGEGPDRTACLRCGACMVGCRYGAKNTLMKNYLYFAEKLGVEIIADTTVKDLCPLGAADGSDGYAVTTVPSGSWTHRPRRTLTAKGVVVASGAVGTNLLLARARHTGSLPRLSDQVGQSVRTNSEALLAVTAKDDGPDFADSVAITSSIYPNADTHIENVTYGRGGGAMGLLFTLLTPGGSRATRWLKTLAQVGKRPGDTLRLAFRRLSWSRRTVILLVMQTLPGRMSFRSYHWGNKVALNTRQDPEHPNPTFIPVGNQAAAMAADEIGGFAQSNIFEAILNIPATAHILGGAVIAADPEHGVVDRDQRAFGYQNLLICDGSVMPANPGVNPSLTILALAEHAISRVPAAAQS